MADSETQTYYAFIKNSQVVNVSKASSEFIQSLIANGTIDESVSLGDGPRPNIGDLYSGGVFSAPLPNIQTVRALKLADFSTAINAYIDARYPDRLARTLLTMYTLAKEDGLANRAAYLRQALTWGNSIASYAAQFQASVLAENDVATVLAMQWDIENNVSADPGVKPGVALQIPD